MKTKLFIFSALFGALFMLQSCEEEGDTIFPEEKLQFNRAILLDLDDSNNYDTTIVVPSGMVWKIETGASFRPSNQCTTTILLNTTPIWISQSGDYNYQESLPVWLEAGTYNFSITTTGCATVTHGFVSGVEYNVVP